MTERPLWTVDDMVAAMNASRAGSLPGFVSGISIDTRTVAAGEAFFAIKGDNRDGHDFVEGAHKAGAGLAVVAADKRVCFAAGAPLLVVPDVLEALRALARAARRRSEAAIIAVTGSVGKTGTKEALRLALGAQGETHASAASYNNHWGVPLSLARCPASARFAIFELGMNHAGEIEPLSRLVRPQVAIITAVEPVHLEFFDSLEAIADAKAEIFSGLEAVGIAVINRDSGQFDRLEKNARSAGVERIVSFGEHAAADVRLVACRLYSEGSDVEARIFGHELGYRLGAPGRHVVLNSLAARALAGLRPAPGRGARVKLDLPGGKILLLDESYNANPASMRAALALLGQAAPAEMQGSSRSRRMAVLGDMLELGPSARELHRGLADAVVANGVDLVFCCGPLMRGLWEALPASCRGRYAQSSAELQTHVLAAVRPGDIVMVKGSLGSRMGLIVKTLEDQVRREPLAHGALRAPIMNG